MSSAILGIKLMGAVLAGSAIVLPIASNLDKIPWLSPPPQKETKQKEEDKNKYYRENCYVVESTSRFADKLLVCNNGNYFLYKSGDNKPFRKVKYLTVKDKDNILLDSIQPEKIKQFLIILSLKRI